MSSNVFFKYLLYYTISFSVILLGWCSPFIFGGYSPLVNGDALIQHYPALVYIGLYIKEFVSNIGLGVPVLPLYDFSIGMGDDIITTLMVHSANASIGNLLFAIFPVSHSLGAYVILIILRLYAAGLTFSYFGASVLKTDRRYVLIGALIYTFCNWALLYAFRHVSYLLALVYLPLIIAGFDAVLKNKKPYLFIVSVFLMGLASFYFLYMQTVFMIFYALIRIHMLHKENYFKSLIGYGLKSVGFYITGIMMASVNFIPIFTAYLNSGREAHINIKSLWYFSFSDYLNIFTAFHSIEIFGNVTKHPTGISPIAAAAIVLLLVSKQIKYRKHLILGVVLVWLFILIPFGSFLLNGFGFYANRCGFLFSFVFAAVTVLVLPSIINTQSGKQYKKSVASLAVYTCILLTAILINPDNTYNMIVGFGFLLVIITTLLLPVGSQTVRFFKTERVKINFIISLVTINLTFNACFFEGLPFVSDAITNGYLNRVLKVSDYIKDDSFYREHNHLLSSSFHLSNLSILNNYHGTAEYWSLANPAYQAFSAQLENSRQIHMEFRVMGFDDRTVLNALSAVKYYIADNENVPFGYVEYGRLHDLKSDQQWVFYTNKYALPLGYTYTKTVSTDAYDKLDALDKQTVLMQAVVLNDTMVDYSNADIPSMLNKVKIPYTTDNEQSLETPEMSIFFEGLPNSETYIRFSGIEYINKDFYSTVDIESGNIVKTISIDAVDYIIRRDGQLLNLGYSQKGKNTAKLTFGTMEHYTIQEIEVYCLPMDDFPTLVEALREDVLENIVIGINKITGGITLEQDKVLVLSIPYSKGWSCKVNGERHTLLQANHLFMGLPLDAGHHLIELTYRTPGLLAGAIVSVVGVLMFVVIGVFYKRR